MTIDEGEQELLRATLRHVLDTNPPAGVPAALIAEGWADLVDADPGTAITALAEEAGRLRSAAPVANLAVLWGAGLAADAATAVIIDGFSFADAIRAERFVRVAPDGIVAVASAHVALAPAGGFDPALGLLRADFDARHAEAIGNAAVAEAAIAAGRRALAAQMVGAAGQMLADTLVYVTDRHQYGRAIGSFQTVKHRLAEVKVAVVAAAAGVRAAWEVGDAVTAIAAKCLAGRAQQLASQHCFQVHGGIAFTVEHGFQQWVRRGLLLDALLGPHDQLVAELGRRIIATGEVPRVPALNP